jgi:hypothetical protein
MRGVLWGIAAAVVIGCVQIGFKFGGFKDRAEPPEPRAVTAADDTDAHKQTERIQLIWARILAAGWPERVPAPLLAYSARAWVHSQSTGEVIFGPHLLAARDDEVAFALAHELAHIVLDHHAAIQSLADEGPQTVRSAHWLAEFDADARARRLMRLAGFDERGIASYFARHARVSSGGASHPSGHQRVRVLGLAGEEAIASR